MTDFFKKSLANRLLFSFISIGFLPFIIFLIYTLVLSETKIVNKLILDQHHNVEVVSKLIKTHLTSLDKEVSFLSRLDVMDDILADDIDKRISRLLEQKKEDYSLSLEFFVVSNNNKIIASSSKDKLSNNCSLKQKFSKNKGIFFLNENLYIYNKIFASFDKTETIGILILEYKLDNLRVFLDNSRQEHAFMMKKDKSLYIGNRPSFDITIKNKKGSVSLDNYLVVYQKMDNILKDWYIFYMVKKDIALYFFYNFIHFMLYLSPFILVLIIVVSVKFSKYIFKPIEKLTNLTDEIIVSKEYSKYLDMVSEDEIGRLANSFNTLLNTTDKTIDASDAKSAFISNMSHELKTPLNAIIGFSQYLISYENLTDEQLDIVSNIESSSQYLLEMIHGILDIAKIEAGKVDININTCDCKSLAQECFSMLEPLAQDKDLSFDFNYEKYTLKKFKTDEKIFKQILLNLLSNAIKYTKKGSINLELSNTTKEVFVKIKDSGIGIEKEEMPKLFKEFSRIDNTLSSKQKGTGLGLSLSKKLAQVLDADIYLKSDGLNKGTEAIFVLKVRS